MKTVIWKKFMAGILSGAMVIGVLTGCGNSNGDSSTSAAGSAADSSSDNASGSDDALTLEAIKAKGTLVVATEAAYEPFEFLDDDGETIIGYNADLLSQICADLGVELEYVDLPFQGILAGLEAKKYDMVGATLGITKERAEKYTITLPIQCGTNVFIKRADDDSIETAEDMAGKIVGTQTSSYSEEDTVEYNESVIAGGGEGYGELKTYDSFPEAYTELRNGQIDLVAQNYASASALVKENPDLYALVPDENGDAAKVSVSDTWLGWAVRKSDTELSDYINSEIEKFKENGFLDELQEKWFGETVDLPSTDYIPEE